jgi:hypothetical protein
VKVVSIAVLGLRMARAALDQFPRDCQSAVSGGLRGDGNPSSLWSADRKAAEVCVRSSQDSKGLAQ